MKNVCFILPRFLPVPAVKGGAIETLITNIIDINELREQLSITVVTVYDTKAIDRQQQYRHTRFINVHQTKLDDYLFLLFRIGRKYFKKYILLFNQYEYRAFKEIKKANYDLVINESSEFYSYIHLTNIIGKRTVAAHLHCEIANNKHFAKTYGSIITVSNYIKDKYLLSGGYNSEDVYVLHNGIIRDNFAKVLSDEERRQLKLATGFCENDFVVIFSGRIVAVKGVLELIKAIVRLKDQNVKLLIVGSPNFALKSRSEYLERVEKIVYDNKEQIKFTGFVQNTDLYRYYNISDIAVIPSTYDDPGPLVPIEAMAAGKPIIATNSGGIWEYVNEKCAVKIYKEKDIVSQLVKEISNLANNRGRIEEMKLHSTMLSKEFDVSNYYSNFCDIVDKITSSHL